MTGFAAAVVEAWQELRIHKLRVLLSLIGVGVAVCSLTTAVAVGSIAQQAMIEQSERDNGRPATFSLYPYNDSGTPPAISTVRRAVAKTMETFDIDYFSISAEIQSSAVLAGRKHDISVRVVDPPYAHMRRVTLAEGRWFTEADAMNYSPAIVVDPRFLKSLGLSPGSLPATVTLNADSQVTATIIGQAAKGHSYSDQPMAFILAGSYQRWYGKSQPLNDINYQIWVPTKGAKALGKALRAEFKTQLPGMSIALDRQDYLAYGGGDTAKEFKYVVGGISALILLLGAMSLLNIALVTIKQRIREIGIRRSFGATTGRIFFSVMMESVVATFVAGVVGVVAAVGIVSSPLVGTYVANGVTDLPPFPLSAGLLGLFVSLFVGALAGLLPALIAVRVRIIDAIRF